MKRFLRVYPSRVRVVQYCNYTDRWLFFVVILFWIILFFFPFACLFVVVVFFHTLLVCNFLFIYLFLDGLSHEKQLINAYAESKSHSSYFLRQDCRYIVCVHVYAMFTHIYWTSVPQRRYYADMKKKNPPIASIYRFVLILKQKKSQMNFSCI